MLKPRSEEALSGEIDWYCQLNERAHACMPNDIKSFEEGTFSWDELLNPIPVIYGDRESSISNQDHEELLSG